LNLRFIFKKQEIERNGVEMTQVKLMVDLGNSETRAVAQIVEEGIVKHTRGYLLDNHFVVENLATKEMYSPYIQSEEFSKLDSNIFEVSLQVGEKKFDKLVMWGDLATANLPKKLRTPVSHLAKANNLLNYVVLINLMDKVLDWVNMVYPTSSKQTLSKEVQFDLAVLTPPAQVSSARTIFESNLVRTFKYKNLYDGVELDLKVNSVKVLPEGYSSFYSVFLNYADLNLRPHYADLASRNVLIIDFGEGTTDLIGVSSQRFLESLNHTIKIGGSTILSKVRASVNKRLGLDIPIASFKDVLKTCEVQYGSTIYKVREDVEQAIYSVASDIAQEVFTYLRGAEVEVSSFDRLLLVGGGVVPNGSTVTISDALLSELQVELPTLDLVDLQYLEEPEIEGIPFDLTSPRYLNILGLMIGVALAQKTQG
jgi:hypothetical protein